MPAERRLALLAAAVGAAFAAVALGLPHSPGQLRAAFDGMGLVAPVVFALAWAALTPALASGPLLAVASGLVFGVGLGTGVGIAGATLGGIAAFSIARRFGQDATDELSGPRLRRLQERVERRGFLAVLCARMAPGVPATLLNYACGLSRVRLRDFVAGSLLGGAPRILAYTALGASGGRFDSAAAILGLALIAAMGLAGMSVALRRRSHAVAA